MTILGIARVGVALAALLLAIWLVLGIQERQFARARRVLSPAHIARRRAKADKRAARRLRREAQLKADGAP